MGISSEKLLSLGQLFNQAGTMYAAPGSSQAAFNDRMNDTFNAQQQAVALRKQKEAEEKKRKSGLFGKIGSTLGTIAGFAIPGVGPIVGPAIGAALGGSAGQALGGGGFDAKQTLMYGAGGAMTGFGAGMLGAANAVPSAVTPSANLASKIMPGPIGNIMSGANKAVGTMAAQGTSSAATGLGSKLFNNPNVQNYFRSQMQQQMPMQGLSSMFQNTPNGFYMNRNAMQNSYNPYGVEY